MNSHKQILAYRSASTLQVIARRVGLEKIDYKKILVDKYGHDSDRLGEVRMVNGRLDVSGDVGLSNRGLTKLPFKFGKVGGHFFCRYNKLVSLEGAPLEVGGSFICSKNELKSLEHAPLKVGGNCYFSGNKLTSLKGAPLEVGGNFSCRNNCLTSLEGAPKHVGGGFYCNDNKLPNGIKKPAGVKGAFFYP